MPWQEYNALSDRITWLKLLPGIGSKVTVFNEFQWQVTGLIPKKQYEFRVAAVNAAGQSEYSASSGAIAADRYASEADGHAFKADSHACKADIPLKDR